MTAVAQLGVFLHLTSTGDILRARVHRAPEQHAHLMCRVCLVCPTLL